MTTTTSTKPLPQDLYDAHGWTEAAGELEELRTATGEELETYCRESAQNNVDNGDGSVTVDDLTALHNWLVATAPSASTDGTIAVRSVAWLAGHADGIERVTDDQISGLDTDRETVESWFRPGQEDPSCGLISAVGRVELPEILGVSDEDVTEENAAYELALAEYDAGFRAGALEAATSTETTETETTYEANFSAAIEWARETSAGNYLVRYEDTGMTDLEDPGSRCGFGDDKLAEIGRALGRRGLRLVADDRGLKVVR